MPLFTDCKRVGVPNVVDIDAVLAGIRLALETNQLTNNGPRVQEFEAQVAAFLGTAEFVTVNNATNGLMMVAKALKLGIDPSRRKIIVPSFTFCATVNAMVWMGLEPVFCDIDPTNYQLDPSEVRKLISPEVCAILAVHVYGAIGDLEALDKIAKESDIPIFFDAAHAFGCSFNGKKIGHFGRCEIFSFHATKAFNTFEGGGIATNDTALAKQIRQLSNFGFVGYDNIGDIGINSKMSEINAIQGLVMLKHFPLVIQHNRANYIAYQQELASLPDLRVLEHTQTQSNFHYVVIQVRSERIRDRLAELMAEENVILRKYFYPGVHHMTPYSKIGASLPHTDQASSCVLCLPSGLHVSSTEAKMIGQKLAQIYVDLCSVP